MKRSSNRSVATRLRALLLTLGLVVAGVVGVASPASATLGANDYPSNLATAAQDSVADPWGFYNRECTSFVAWRLNNDNGFAFSNNMNGGHFGNAYEWKDNAVSLFGASVYNGTPAKGSVAWWDVNHGDALSMGHVAYVDSVNSDGSINIEQYNTWHNPGGYWKETIATTSSNWPSGFLHIKDIGTDGGTPPAARPGIRNGGFNEGTGYWTRTGTANIAAYSSGQYEGSGYGATNAAAAGDSIRQDVALNSTAGHSYCVSAMVRSNTGGATTSGSLAIYVLGSTATQGSSKAFSGVTNDWTPVESCVTATSSHTTLRVQLYPAVGAPTIGVDVVDMHESLLNSAGFNGSNSGWTRTGTANFALYDSGQYEGTGYAASNSAASGDSIRQDVARTINSGDTYCVDARIRSNTSGSTTSGSLAIWLLGSTATEGSSFQYSDIDTSWNPIKTCVTASGAHTSVRVQFYPAPGAPTVGIDAVALHPTLARNGGFNNGTWLWSRTGTANIAAYGSGQYEGSGYVATNAAAAGDSIRPTQDSTRNIDTGDMYCVSARIRSNLSGSTTSGSLALWMLGTSATENSTIQFSDIGNDWTPIKTCVTATGDHTSLRIQLYPAVGAPTIGVDAIDMG